MDWRNYQPDLGRFFNVDPLAEEESGWSPYRAFFNNPIIFSDPTGLLESPIYDTNGNFLGTDDEGLQGDAIIMNEEDFTQGMSHDEAVENSLGMSEISTEAQNSINDHFSELPNRPDYNGFVSITEGVEWAKANPNALDNPTPDNTLYLDASKLDFGYVNMGAFNNDGEGAVNLFTTENLARSATNSKLRATVYALGRVKLKLEDADSRTISVINDEATDYDWNQGGSAQRNAFIDAERKRTGLNDSHGFKTFYYGTNSIKKRPAHQHITTCFVEETKVLMNDGSSKNIEDIKKGDKIMSVDIGSMKVEEDLVVEIPEIIKEYQIIEMILSDGTILQFSPAHPFWVVDKGWCVYDLNEAKIELTFDVNQIEKGDKVLQYVNGDLKELTIFSIRDTEPFVRMYNVEFVKKNHTFFANGILVHNKYLQDDED